MLQGRRTAFRQIHRQHVTTTGNIPQQNHIVCNMPPRKRKPSVNVTPVPKKKGKPKKPTQPRTTTLPSPLFSDVVTPGQHSRQAASPSSSFEQEQVRFNREMEVTAQRLAQRLDQLDNRSKGTPSDTRDDWVPFSMQGISPLVSPVRTLHTPPPRPQRQRGRTTQRRHVAEATTATLTRNTGNKTLLSIRSPHNFTKQTTGGTKLQLFL